MGVKSFYRRIDLINKSNQLNLLNQKDQILLSFSGGQDSICLLFLLNQLYCQLELHITLLWCHHLWQTDSFYLMQQIAKLSFLFQFNSCFAIPATSLSSELLARKWRQSCSYRVSLFYNNSKICLAHTFNDKVETIFFNFMRGTGLTKLSPLRREQFISKSSTTNEKHVFRHQYPLVFLAKQRTRSKGEPERGNPKGGTHALLTSSLNFTLVKQTDVNSAKLNLLGGAQALVTSSILTTSSLSKGAAKPQKSIARPLLSISRFEIKKICFFWKLPIYPDTSNQKVKFLRNRIRRQLSPTIKFFFNSKIENIFLQLAEIVETEDYRFTQIVNEFTKNIDLYDVKLQTHPTFTLLEKKRGSLKGLPIRNLYLTLVKAANGNFASQGGAHSLLNGFLSKETEKAKLYLPLAKQRGFERTAYGISNAKSTLLVMDEFKNLKFLDLLIQLIEINKFSNNVSLLTELIAKIAFQKNGAKDTKFSKMLIFRFFETYHLTNLDTKKLKKKYAKEPTKILNC